MLYGKSNKQYYVMPQGCNKINDLKLVTNPEFREREDGYCEKALANPQGPVATAQVEPARPIMEIEKRQPVTMPASAPSVVSEPKERERDTELSEMRTESAPQRANEGAVSGNGAEIGRRSTAKRTQPQISRFRSLS